MKTYNEEREQRIQTLEALEWQEDHGLADCQLTDEEYKQVAGYERPGWLRELHRKQRVRIIESRRDKITPTLMVICLSVLIIPNAIFLAIALWNY